ncbi:MAG: O-antigen ligase family protein [Clostridia bacterium]|nr:O-antigen ligase family protein [Clostridia bacterium]
MITKAIHKRFTSFAIIFLLIFIALYIENGYFNITGAKYRALIISMAVLILPMLFFFTYRLIKRNKYEKMPICISEAALIGFAVVSIISSLLSERISESFWGSNGWRIGAFTICLLAFLYFFLSRSLEYNQNIWLPVMAVNLILFILGILQFARLDFTGMHDHIMPKQYYQYISTLGNTNWVAGYLCLIIPMIFVFFLLAKNKSSFTVNLVFLIFAFSNLLLCISDGAYIGLGFCAFFAVPFIFADKTRIKRTLLLLSILFFEAVIIGILPCYQGLFERISGISGVILDLRISLPAFILFSILYIFVLLSKKDSKRLRIGLCIGFESLLFLAVAGFFVYTAITFSDDFGSSRGAIWRVSFENFSRYSLKEKLIGIGPELLRQEYEELQMSTRFKGLAILSSHSEPIQALVTMGILGVGLWFAMFIGVFKEIKKATPHSFAFVLGIAAYFGQSFVNSATVLNLTLLCIMFAMYRITAKSGHRPAFIMQFF